MGRSFSCLPLTQSNESTRFSSFLLIRFNEVYEIGCKIGTGSFAAVHKCRHRQDDKEFAVKIIDKKHLQPHELSGLRAEIEILQKLKHPNIINLIDVFEDARTVFIVLELCQSDDLLDCLIARPKSRVNETEAAHILLGLCNALQHLHENCVIHRDLKPENILFDQHGNVKIADFGLAYSGGSGQSPSRSPSPSPDTLTEDRAIDSSSCSSTCSSIQEIVMSDRCGTPNYVAPEVIQQCEYNYKCDVWSLGVILYVMLAGYLPFETQDGDLRHIYHRITGGRYHFNTSRWIDVSDDAKHLVTRLLTVDPSKRMEVDEIVQHPWIKKHCCD